MMDCFHRTAATAILVAWCGLCHANAPDAAAPDKVRYVVTDFTAGDGISGGPLMAFLADGASPAGGTPVESGEICVDFSIRDEVVLYRETPVWGNPEEGPAAPGGKRRRRGAPPAAGAFSLKLTLAF